MKFSHSCIVTSIMPPHPSPNPTTQPQRINQTHNECLNKVWSQYDEWFTDNDQKLFNHLETGKWQGSTEHDSKLLLFEEYHNECTYQGWSQCKEQFDRKYTEISSCDGWTDTHTGQTRPFLSPHTFHKLQMVEGKCPLSINIPDSKAYGASMGPIWGGQDPGGPRVGLMNFVIWDNT